MTKGIPMVGIGVTEMSNASPNSKMGLYIAQRIPKRRAGVYEMTKDIAKKGIHKRYWDVWEQRAGLMKVTLTTVILMIIITCLVIIY